MKARNGRAFTEGRRAERLDTIERQQREHEIRDAVVHEQVNRHDEILKAQEKRWDANARQHEELFKLVRDVPARVLERLNEKDNP